MNNAREEELIEKYIIREYFKAVGMLATLAEAGVHESVLMERLSEQMSILRTKITKRVEVGITRAWNASNKATFQLMDKKFSNIELPHQVAKVIYDPNQKALEAFIKREKGGLNLSDRIWEQAKESRKIIKRGLKTGIDEGKPAREIAKNIKEALLEPSIPTAQGVYKSPFKNAMRVVRTEVNGAYRTADQANWNKNPLVLGYKISVSNTKSKRVKARCELCVKMAGTYPNTFKWSAWHPNCYSDDTEIMTNNGWKLFKDLLKEDLIYSLNPDTMQPEYVSYNVFIKKKYKGDIIRYSNRSLDMLVTPDHPMKYINSKGEWAEKKAKEFGKDMCIVDGVFIEKIGRNVNKTTESYDSFVYDVQLERNHIMYVRRNGKCVWGSNCLCIKTPITLNRDYMDEYNRLIARGEDTREAVASLRKRAGLVEDLPEQLKQYVKGGGGTKTWWYSDNKKMFESLQ